jgi:hypothetical protein
MRSSPALGPIGPHAERMAENPTPVLRRAWAWRFSFHLGRVPGAAGPIQGRVQHETTWELLGHVVAESFFATLKKELREIAHWDTHAQARRDLFETIEIWYNRLRRHSTVGYKSPAQYEDQLALTSKVA